MLTISPDQARRMVLHAQGLTRGVVFPDGKAGVEAVIRHLGYVQIDTISVAMRAHDHVLWTRVPDYKPQDLAAAQAQKTIFEYWAHAAAYLPIEHFQYSLARKHAISQKHKHWFEREHDVITFVLDRIRHEGPLQSRDFDAGGHSGGTWYSWKPAKRALEQLFMEGGLVVTGRKGFQKIFDLPERFLPEISRLTLPDPEASARHLILTGLRAQGLATPNELGYLRPYENRVLKKIVLQMAEAGEIIPLQIEGSARQVYYHLAHTDIPDQPAPPDVWLLSPFDNFVIQRERLRQLFNFDYQIECYVPAPKRKYGYYTLPILWGETCWGRLDPKADRKSNTLYIQGIWPEQSHVPDEAFIHALVHTLRRFASACGCEAVVVPQHEPWLEKLAVLLR
ncbi:MAG: crosslink repair DNA glycosylase YcaQ family protein [Bacteroidia bacterium]|nr:crosslink repair DNA glycosylase YcaQ family protein [Bacteroidia bacterium]